MKKKYAFTLAETLITITIIGIVAAITLPNFIYNIQQMIRNEQARTVKYKLTLATDKMKSLGLIGPYSTTEDFVNELQKHLKIVKVCKSNNLSDCWPTDSINIANSSVQVNTLVTGNDIKSLVLGSMNSDTIGIVTADGTPMLLTYSPRCTPLEAERTYNWITDDNHKPVTNATTNCICALFDVNGNKKPNFLGKDVRTLNSLFGYNYSGSHAISDCSEETKKKYNLPDCVVGGTYDGAKKYCQDLGLRLPDKQLASILMGSRVGLTEFDINKVIAKKDFYHCTINNPSYYCVDNYESGTLPEINTKIFWLEGANTYYYGRKLVPQARTNKLINTLCVPN